MLGRHRASVLSGPGGSVLQLAREVKAKSGEHVKPLVDILPYRTRAAGWLPFGWLSMPSAMFASAVVIVSS